METSMFVVGIVIGCILGLTIGLAFWGDAYGRVTNDPELRQCLSQGLTKAFREFEKARLVRKIANQ